jgi:flagellar biosynthesis/type III secretory pathway protein FliH
MTAVKKLPVDAPLARVRLHPDRPQSGSPAAARVEWLLSLAEREQQAAAERAAVLAAAKSIEATLRQLPGTVDARLDQVAALAVELGLAIAREVIGATLDAGRYDPTPTVVRCLRDCVHGSDRADLSIRLHPDDLAAVLDRLAAQPELRAAVADARIEADPGLARGAVVAESGAGRLRHDPREVFERVSAAIRREGGG